MGLAGAALAQPATPPPPPPLLECGTHGELEILCGTRSPEDLEPTPDGKFLTWTDKHQLLAAGVKGARGDCPPGSGIPCAQTFGVAEIDPAKMVSHTVFDSEGKGALISGASVALQVGPAI
jgi:hypothetical protein